MGSEHLIIIVDNKLVSVYSFLSHRTLQNFSAPSLSVSDCQIAEATSEGPAVPGKALIVFLMSQKSIKVIIRLR